MDVSTHRVPPVFINPGIRSLHRFGRPYGPLAETVLYPQDSTHEVLPK